MNGVKASKEGFKKFAAILKREIPHQRKCSENSLFVLRRFWGASIEKVSPLKLL